MNDGRVAPAPLVMRARDAARVRDAPGMDGAHLATVQQGVLVAVDGPLVVDGWRPVTVCGWMATDLLDEVDDADIVGE